MFTTFPAGLPGLGLLILRLTIAGSIQFFCFFFYFDLIGSTFRGWLIGAVAIVFSAAMMTGFLTPVAGALIFIGGVIFLILSPRGISAFLVIYLSLLAFVMTLLGPGAFSVDARLFGRREIILSKKN